ncbi:MAG: M15 family metallopeptidase [Duncaniella sp.]|nr:M15 family metallopeptidase [Duncaniella sp.]
MKYCRIPRFLSIVLLLSISIMHIHSQSQTTTRTLEQKLRDHGLVNVAELDSTVCVSLMYARSDNFTGVLLYDDGFNQAYLHPDAASALVRAQAELASLAPGYRLLIKDAARPMSIQKRMFKAVSGTPKANYVANPAKGGGLHNYGLAVDITIVDPAGREISMGTPVDHLGTEANIDKEEILVRRGVISETERQNRLLLRRVMTAAGFHTIRTEWWHFNLVNKAKARASFRRLDF